MCWNTKFETSLKLEQLCWLLGSCSELRFVKCTAAVKSGTVMSMVFISLLWEWSFSFQEQWKTSTSAENNMQSFNADSWETTRNELIKGCCQHHQDQFPLLISSEFSPLVCYTHRSSAHRQTQAGQTDFDGGSQSGLVFWCTRWLHTSSLNRSLLTDELTSSMES